MTLQRLLSARRTEIWKRWRRGILETYPGKTAVFFGREGDQHANPVGHTISTSTRLIVDALVDGAASEELREHLEPLVKLRSIQDFSPSEAVSFVFSLDEIARDELARQLQGEPLYAATRELEKWVRGLGLLAFDIYSSCREQVCELRINEVKRSVSTLLRRAQRGFGPDEEAGSAPQTDGG